MLKRIINKIRNNNIYINNNQNNREVWLENKLKKIYPGKKILDAGAGELQYKKYCSHLNYVSQDFGKYDGKGDSHGLQKGGWDNGNLNIVSDITDIPEEKESFDAIMCIEVFEHLPNPIDAIKEFSRLLKKNGTLILTAPFCSLTHFSPYHFSTGFNKYFYKKWLNYYGFVINECIPNGNYFDFINQEIHRIPEVLNKYNMKTKDEYKLIQIINCLSKYLLEYSKKDIESSELLCFGYHIEAIKKEMGSIE